MLPHMQQETVLEARDLVKRFGEREALRRVSLSADRGELVAVIGPNGAGKTTLLTILTMLVVGGARTLVGSVVGPFLLLALPQALALVELPPTIIGPMRQLVYGALLVAFMMFRPQGIAGQKL